MSEMNVREAAHEAAAVRRRVVLLLATTFLSSSASLAGVTALGLLVYDITQRELALGFLGLAEFMPALVLVLVTVAIGG